MTRRMTNDEFGMTNENQFPWAIFPVPLKLPTKFDQSVLRQAQEPSFDRLRNRPSTGSGTVLRPFGKLRTSKLRTSKLRASKLRASKLTTSRDRIPNSEL